MNRHRVALFSGAFDYGTAYSHLAFWQTEFTEQR